MCTIIIQYCFRGSWIFACNCTVELKMLIHCALFQSPLQNTNIILCLHNLKSWGSLEVRLHPLHLLPLHSGPFYQLAHSISWPILSVGPFYQYSKCYVNDRTKLRQNNHIKFRHCFIYLASFFLPLFQVSVSKEGKVTSVNGWASFGSEE